jgi:hypothetical protein
VRIAVLALVLSSCTVQENVTIPLPDCIEVVLVGEAGVKLGKCPTPAPEAAPDGGGE